MLRLRRLLALSVITAPVLGLAIASCSKPADQSSTTTVVAEDTLAHGRYLAIIAGCGDCHTPGTLWGAPDTTRAFSGSETGWSGPWGVSYARNLTPDSTTGIGTWTEEQIVNAIRTGQRPNGDHLLLPPMPWPNFVAMPDKDAYAIAKYLKSIPAVSHQVPDIVPPGQKPKTPVYSFPPKPAAWDAPKPAAPGTPATGGSTG